MKKLITIVVAAVLVLNIAFAVSATSDFSQKEFAAQLEAVKLDADANDKSLLTLDNSYPIYNYSDVKGGEYDGTFASHLDEYPAWIFNDGKWEYAYYFDTELKKWKLDSVMSSVSNYPDENGIPLPLSLNKLAGIAEQKLGDNIDDFKIVWCEYALCLYGVVDGTEKIVYYSTRPDINKLENGNVYSAEDVMKNAYKGGSAPESVYDESNPVIIDGIVMKPQMYGGGSGGTQSLNERYADMLEQVKNDCAVRDISLDNSFFRFYYDDVNVDASKPFGEHLTDEKGFWIYAKDEKSSVLYRFDTELNLWLRASEEKVEQFVDKDGKSLDIKYSFNGFTEFAKNKLGGNIDGIKITARGAGNEYATYIYFKSGDKAYVIPLAPRAKIKCGLISGEIYDAESAKEMFDKMEADISSDGKQLLKDKYTDMLEQVKKDTGAQDINFDNIFLSYFYDDINTDLEKPFGEHLSNDNAINFWLVPNGNQTREFVYDTELKKWRENKNGYFFTDFVDEDGNLLDIKCSLNGFMEFAENKLDSDIDDIKITRRGYGDNSAVYIYLESDKKSYVIPLSSRAIIKCGLISGKLYDAEVAKEMFDKTIVFHDEPVGGGASEGANADNGVPADKPDYTVYIIIGGVAAVAVIAAVVTLLLKKKR